ncbi:hypothetical protein QQ045_020559 [Rhodiola kirilowii]
MGLQTVWSVAAASSLALKAELMERNPRGFQAFPRYPPQESSETVGDNKGDNVGLKEHHAGSKSVGGPSGSSGGSHPNHGAVQRPPTPTLNHQGHRSNVYPTRMTVALLEEREAEEHDEGDEYEGVEFAEEEESIEAVNIVLQRVLLTTPDEGQRKNLFKFHCSILKKVSKGSQVRVTRTCKVPISIGKHYREEVPCNVLDMDVCHVLLGRPWQYDLDVTYRGWDNVMMFTWEKHKIAMTPISSFDRQPSKQSNFLVMKHSEKEFSADVEEIVVVKEEI